ncbi:hypothetical protein VNO77_12258 [Canavalia gladiata]|uniref:Protein TIC 21, chloroplastic n=1 Tax=Canavalia gladiata TaxID=3824 RepID=A0AAN9M0H6_CANGL
MNNNLKGWELGPEGDMPFYFLFVFAPFPLGSVPSRLSCYHGQRQLWDRDNDSQMDKQSFEKPPKRKNSIWVSECRLHIFGLDEAWCEKAEGKRPKKANRYSSFFFTPTTAMQTLLLPATRAGSFTSAPPAAPLAASALSVPRLPQTFLRPNSLPSLSLNLTNSSSSSASSIVRRPWKLPFTVSASSQVSPAFTPSNDESEKAKLEQVSKRLEKTARYFKRLGSLGFWGQLVCTVVAAVILSFSVVVTGKVTSPATFYATATGIVAAFVSVFWSFGYIRLSEKLRRTANDPTKAPPRADVVKGLKNGIIMNLFGMGAAILGMQATVGLLVAKALTSSATPYYQGISPGYSPVLALDVFLVQASANTILSHFLGLVFSLELLRSVTLPPSEAIPFPKFA